MDASLSMDDEIYDPFDKIAMKKHEFEFEAYGKRTVVVLPGMGDGAYTAFWGLDEEGKPAVLMVDFDLLSPYEEEEEE